MEPTAQYFECNSISNLWKSTDFFPKMGDSFFNCPKYFPFIYSGPIYKLSEMLNKIDPVAFALA